MKLYEILKRHYSAKDSEDAICYFLVANNAEEVFDYLDNKELSNIWTYRNEEYDLLDIYDDNFEVIGQETYKQKMIRICGEFFDDDADTSDSYYGLTHYGWKEVTNSKDLYQEVEALKRLGIVRFISQQEYDKFIKSQNIKSF